MWARPSASMSAFQLREKLARKHSPGMVAALTREGVKRSTPFRGGDCSPMDTPAALPMCGAFDWDWSDLRLRCLTETRRVLGHGGAAEDATQEALIRAWRQRDSCQDPRRPGPWISTIARREALRLASRHRRDTCLDFGRTAPPLSLDTGDC